MLAPVVQSCQSGAYQTSVACPYQGRAYLTSFGWPMDLWAVLETFCRSPFVAPGASESNQNNLKVHWQPGLKGHSKCLTLIWREYSRNMFERSHLFPCKKFHPAISCLYLEGHHHHQPDRAIDPMQQSTTATTAHILILTCTGKELELKDRKEPSLAIATLKSALQINVFFDGHSWTKLLLIQRKERISPKFWWLVLTTCLPSKLL